MDESILTETENLKNTANQLVELADRIKTPIVATLYLGDKSKVDNILKLIKKVNLTLQNLYDIIESTVY